MADEHDSDRGGPVWGPLLDESHLVAPDALPRLVADVATRIGAHDLTVLLVDHAQTVLLPFPPQRGADEEGIAIDATVAGRAFRRVQAQEVPAPDGRRRVWVPVVDGTDRLGVVGVTVAEHDERLADQLRQLAALLAYLITSKTAVGDAIVRAGRRRPMDLAAELQWQLMPPLTVATRQIAISAMLEPAYEVGGDAMDYAVDEDVARLAVFDAMGHGLQASLLASLAVGTYRNARRSGRGLAETGMAIDAALAGQFGAERFVTALLFELDVEDGALRWITAGHPPPLLLRDGRIVKALEERPDRPLGLALNERLRVHEEALEPGDRLFAYTDGVVEARNAAGEQFGLDRLADFLVRALASDEPVPETMRRLSKAVLAHQDDALQDDATHVMLAWLTDPEPLTP